MKETLGQRIQRLRKNANLTQEDVAARLNISSQAVSKWENDNSAPDLSVLLELAEMLGVTTDELLGKTPTVSVVEPAQRKPIEKLLLKIRVLSTEGDKVNVNLPLAVVKIIVDSGVEMAPVNSNGKNMLKGIDFEQVFALVEQGVIGKLVEIQSEDGDTVEIWVE